MQSDPTGYEPEYHDDRLAGPCVIAWCALIGGLLFLAFLGYVSYSHYR